MTNGSPNALPPVAWPPAASPETTGLPTELSSVFLGPRGALFWLALKTSLFTVLTLGLYRFWMKTRLRRWYWSSVRIGGQPLEYVGEPLEKLLGFLVAVVIMAFYIGIVNLVLMFGSFALLAAPGGAYLLSALGVLPIVFFAQYRSRRYVLARTRWRGMRFGLEPGAWGYAAEAIRQWILTLLTLGFWWPNKRFLLEKYKTDRTFFGTVRLEQRGRPADLYPAFAHVYVPGLLLILSLVLSASEENARILWLSLALGVWALIGALRYEAIAMRYLTTQKFADGLRLVSRIDPKRITRIYLLGNALVWTIILVPLLALYGAIGIWITLNGAEEGMTPVEVMSLLPGWVLPSATGVTYAYAFLAYPVLMHIFITQPYWRHVAEVLELYGADGLAEVSQRARDDFEEAEGFAEALDVGAAL